MAHIFNFDVGSVYTYYTGQRLSRYLFFKCYSVIEHEISDLGFVIDTVTYDSKGEGSDDFPNSIIEALKIMVSTSLLCIPAEKEVYISVANTMQNIFIIVV